MRQTIRFFSAMLAIMLVWQVSMAQNRTITGTVKDQKGEEIIGASVIVKGTTIGTYTDEKGNFSLSVPPTAATLIVKYLGYKSQEVPISASNVINVTLEEDVLGLNEVIVTAIGVSREKKAISYSTQSISGDDLGNTGSGNTLSELNGKISGLTVINSTGDPGGGTYIRLRGVTSISGNNQPLIVVDGVPLDNSINAYDPTNVGFQAAGPAGNAVGGVSPDNRGIDINPNDIASITVLKGPAATALYGIQAASGALIITTKKGGGSTLHHGPTISFSSGFSADYVNKYPELQNDYAQGSNGTYYGPTAPTSSKKFSWGPKIDTLAWDGVPNDYDVHGNIVSIHDPTAVMPVTPYDNVKNFFVTGRTLDNTIAIGGGNDIAGYRLSVGNNHQEGVVPLTDYDKSSVTVSGQANLSSKLKSSGSITYIKSGGNRVQAGSNVSGLMLGLLRTPITFDDANGTSDPANNTASYLLPDGTQRDYRNGPGYDNPYWTVNRNPFNEDVNRFYGFAQLDYTPLSWMSWTYRLGGDEYSQSNTNGYGKGSNAFPEGSLFQDDYFNKQYNSDLIVNLHKDFSQNFNAALILGHNYFVNTSSEHWAQGDGFALPDFFSMANASSYLAVRRSGEKRTMAFYGDLQLGFKDMLFFDFTGRNETSSTLPAENNNFFFPSASVGFVFTEPLGLSTSKVFPYGKIRFSVANVGKDAPVQALQTYFTSALITDGFTGGLTFPFNGIAAYQLSNLTQVVGDPILKPERTNSFEGGIDLAFVQNRLSFSGTYYHEKTKDQIFTVPTAASTGFAAAVLNAGEISNSGIELTLNITPIKTKSGLQWDLMFNWSKNTNKVISLYAGIDRLLVAGFGGGEAEVDAAAGQPYGIIYGTDFERTPDGTLVISDDSTTSGYGQPIVGAVSVPLGNTNPDWIGSVRSNLSFKGITLGIQVDVRQGGVIWDGTRGALSYFGRSAETDNRGQATTFPGALGHISTDATSPLNGTLVHYDVDGTTEIAGAGATNTIPSVYNQSYWQNIGSSFIGAQSSDIEDGSFVKLREISLGYDLPKAWISQLRLSNLSISFFASNIILHTNYTGVDPETSLIGPANGQGLDYFNNPGTKHFGVRINLGL